jgi:hypothetical protein
VANAGTLLVPIYLNRSKIGNLQLLRQFAQQHQLTLAGIGNRTDPLVKCFFDDFLVTSFDRAAFGQAFTGWQQQHGRPAGIFCLGEDEVPLCAELSRATGLPGNTGQSAIASRSKLAMRTALRDTDVPMPRSFPVASLARAQRLLGEEFGGRNAFLKPVLGTGSMHCREICKAADLDRAWTELFDASRECAAADPLYAEVFEHGYFMLLEEQIGTYRLPGAGELTERFPVHELSVECVIADGVPHVYGITDKLIPLAADGREHMWRTSRVPADLRASLTRHVGTIVSTLGLRIGGLHAEFRLEPARGHADAVIDGTGVQATLLEVAARMGGAYMQSFWQRSTGFDAVAWLAAQACGMPVAPPHIRVLNPAIMLNIWPQGSGPLAGLSDVDAVRARSAGFLDELVIYDRPGEHVESGPGAERGIGHVAFRDRATDALTASESELTRSYATLEALFLQAYDHVRGFVAPAA